MRESSEIVFILVSFHPVFTSWRPIYHQNMTKSLQHARKRWTTNCHKGDYNMELVAKRMEELSRRYLPQHDWALAEQDWWGTHSNTQLTTTRFTKNKSEGQVQNEKCPKILSSGSPFCLGTDLTSWKSCPVDTMFWGKICGGYITLSIPYFPAWSGFELIFIYWKW